MSKKLGCRYCTSKQPPRKLFCDYCGRDRFFGIKKWEYLLSGLLLLIVVSVTIVIVSVAINSIKSIIAVPTQLVVQIPTFTMPPPSPTTPLPSHQSFVNFTSTPMSSSTEIISTNNCNGAYGGRLFVGDTAKIIVFQVAVRSKPGGPDGHPYLNVLAKGQKVEVLNDSICVNGLYFVRVQSPIIDEIGWVAEGDNEQYYLQPLK